MIRSAPVEAEDQELVIEAATGNREAFGLLYERYAVRVHRHAFFLTSDSTLAEDLTAQPFLKALEAISRYQARGIPFVAWLLRITCNLTINHKKALKNNGHAQLPESLESDRRGCSPEECCEAKVDGEFLWRHVRHLSGEQQQVIVMHFIDDLGYPDIAHVLGKSVGAVRVIQFRALANLRHVLEKDASETYAMAAAS